MAFMKNSENKKEKKENLNNIKRHKCKSLNCVTLHYEIKPMFVHTFQYYTQQPKFCQRFEYDITNNERHFNFSNL